MKCSYSLKEQTGWSLELLSTCSTTRHRHCYTRYSIMTTRTNVARSLLEMLLSDNPKITLSLSTICQMGVIILSSIYLLHPPATHTPFFSLLFFVAVDNNLIFYFATVNVCISVLFIPWSHLHMHIAFRLFVC